MLSVREATVLLACRVSLFHYNYLVSNVISFLHVPSFYFLKICIMKLIVIFSRVMPLYTAGSQSAYNFLFSNFHSVSRLYV